MTENEQSATDEIIEVMQDEGRVNPLRLRQRTDLRKQRVNRALNQLVANERVRKVCRGLYELAENPAHDGAGGDSVADTEWTLDCPHCDHTETYTPDDGVGAMKRICFHIVAEHDADKAGDSNV